MGRQFGADAARRCSTLGKKLGPGRRASAAVRMDGSVRSTTRSRGGHAIGPAGGIIARDGPAPALWAEGRTRGGGLRVQGRDRRAVRPQRCQFLVSLPDWAGVRGAGSIRSQDGPRPADSRRGGRIDAPPSGEGAIAGWAFIVARVVREGQPFAVHKTSNENPCDRSPRGPEKAPRPGPYSYRRPAPAA